VGKKREKFPVSREFSVLAAADRAELSASPVTPRIELLLSGLRLAMGETE
jgi:hypothetical protein